MEFKPVFTQSIVQDKISIAMLACGLRFAENLYVDKGGMVRGITDGIKLTPHRNTWKRKRATSYLVRIEYFWEGHVIMTHVEPWVNFPSDLLVTKLTLLPRKVSE